MIETVEPYFHFQDDRGSFDGLVNFGEWREMNLVTSAGNSVRGNHYHKKTRELFIILEGKIEVQAQRVVNGALSGPVKKKVVTGKDVFIIDPMVNHTFHILEPARWINVLSHPIEKETPDFYRTNSGD